MPPANKLKKKDKQSTSSSKTRSRKEELKAKARREKVTKQAKEKSPATLDKMSTKDRCRRLEMIVEGQSRRLNFLENEYRRLHPWHLNKLDNPEGDDETPSNHDRTDDRVGRALTD
jgi:hypothetical protein